MKDEVIHNISRRGNFAWVCIPKVATVSIRQTIVKFDPKVETVNLAGLTEEKLQNPGLFIFAYIRDPVDRLVSCWRNIIREANRDAPRLLKAGLNNDSSWEEFLKMVFSKNRDNCDMHWRPQAKFVNSEYGGVAPDFLGGLSLIAETWTKYIRDKTGLGPLLVEHVSQTPKPTVTREQDALIREFYKADEALFTPQESKVESPGEV